MGKEYNLNSGFLISYDWLAALEMLSGEDCKNLLFALIRRQKDGEPLPTFENPLLNVFADMMEPTIKRRLSGQAGGNKAKEQPTPVPTPVPTTPSKVEYSKVEHSRVDTPPKAPKGADVIRERFDRFWEAYPQKRGKGDARKVFEKLKPSAELTERMISAISAQKRTDQWTRERGQYIPNPATWLRQERWDDECAAAAAPVVKDISYDEFFNGFYAEKGDT